MVLLFGIKAFRKEVVVVPLLKLALPSEMVVLSRLMVESPMEVVVTPREMDEPPIAMVVLPLEMPVRPTDTAVFPSVKLVLPMEDRLRRAEGRGGTKPLFSPTPGEEKSNLLQADSFTFIEEEALGSACRCLASIIVSGSCSCSYLHKGQPGLGCSTGWGGDCLKWF